MPVRSSGSRQPGRPSRAFRLAYFDARPITDARAQHGRNCSVSTSACRPGFDRRREASWNARPGRPTSSAGVPRRQNRALVKYAAPCARAVYDHRAGGRARAATLTGTRPRPSSRVPPRSSSRSSSPSCAPGRFRSAAFASTRCWRTEVHESPRRARRRAPERRRGLGPQGRPARRRRAAGRRAPRRRRRGRPPPAAAARAAAATARAVAARSPAAGAPPPPPRARGRAASRARAARPARGRGAGRRAQADARARSRSAASTRTRPPRRGPARARRRGPCARRRAERVPQ